jgi:hypothetical protein
MARKDRDDDQISVDTPYGTITGRPDAVREAVAALKSAGAMDPGWTIDRLRAALERYSPALREGLRAALTQRTFPPHPRYKGRAPPSLVEADALCGIHVTFFYPDWQPVIGGLSRAGACKSGVRVPIDLRTENPWHDDPGYDAVLVAAERWIADAWRAVRGVAPDLCGFMSENEDGSMIDLDSGDVVPHAELEMGPQ